MREWQKEPAATINAQAQQSTVAKAGKKFIGDEASSAAAGSQLAAGNRRRVLRLARPRKNRHVLSQLSH